MGSAGAAPVTVDGEPVTLQPDDVIITQTPRSGWAVATDAGETVALEVDDHAGTAARGPGPRGHPAGPGRAQERGPGRQRPDLAVVGDRRRRGRRGAGRARRDDRGRGAGRAATPGDARTATDGAASGAAGRETSSGDPGARRCRARADLLAEARLIRLGLAARAAAAAAAPRRDAGSAVGVPSGFGQRLVRLAGTARHAACCLRRGMAHRLDVVRTQEADENALGIGGSAGPPGSPRPAPRCFPVPPPRAVRFPGRLAPSGGRGAGQVARAPRRPPQRPASGGPRYPGAPGPPEGPAGTSQVSGPGSGGVSGLGDAAGADDASGSAEVGGLGCRPGAGGAPGPGGPSAPGGMSAAGVAPGPRGIAGPEGGPEAGRLSGAANASGRTGTCESAGLDGPACSGSAVPRLPSARSAAGAALAAEGP